jgi:hypothetical protein
MKLIGKKARKLSKKRSKIKKLQKVQEGTSQKENLQNWNFARIPEQCHMALRHGEAIVITLNCTTHAYLASSQLISLLFQSTTEQLFQNPLL